MAARTTHDGCALDADIATLPDAAAGLTSEQARERLARCGPNVIPPRGRRPAVVEYLLHFRNPLVLLLLASSVVLGWTGDTASMTIILAIVVASVTLDFAQEHRAERALARLQATIAATVVVLRDRRRGTVPVADIVPGDVVLLQAGDIVPADGRLVSADGLFVNEAALTGESYPVEKTTDPATADGGTLRMGSAVTSGTAMLRVEVTGPATALGAVARELAAPEPEHPLERGLRRFGMMILRLTLFLVLFVLLVNALSHRPWLESFVFAVALAVGLTPELLPMIVSVTLARGALRLAAHHVIVKRPAAIYALGSIDILCSDKTGTLTEAAIRVAAVDDGMLGPPRRVLELAAVNSALATGVRSPLDDAILAEAGVPAGYRKLDEAPFDFERRLVSVLVVDQSGERSLIVKGAPEHVIAACAAAAARDGTVTPLGEAARHDLAARYEGLGRQGLRVLAVAMRTFADAKANVAPEDEAELVLQGFVSFADPPRRDAATAVAGLARARVTVKILTGDDPRVAQHLCGQIGLAVAGTLTGPAIDALSDEALAAAASGTTLFCRISPTQKTRVIKALRARGHVVGFIGDGINDAPALHAADVGISVQGATGIAREAADVILTRGRLGVVRDGVIEGRRTYGNIMKYLMMATSSNFGNMLSMAAATVVLPFLPMLPVQILLNNLLYDLSETAIPFDRVDDAELRRPHLWDVREIRRFMLVLGPVSSLFDFLTFAVLLLMLHAGPALFQTGWFIESIATQILVIFVIRTRRSPLRSHPHPLLVATSLAVVAIALALPFTPAAPVLGFVTPPWPYFAVLLALVPVYLALAQVSKQVVYRAHARWAHPQGS